MMGRQDRQSASAGAAAGDQDAARLGHECIACAEPGGTSFELGLVVRLVREEHGQAKGRARRVGQCAPVAGHAIPLFGRGQAFQLGCQVAGVREQLEFGVEIGGVSGEQGRAGVKGIPDGGQDTALVGAGGQAVPAGPTIMRTRNGSRDCQGLPDAGEDVFAFVHGIVGGRLAAVICASLSTIP